MTDFSVAGETFNVLVEGDEAKPVLMLSHPLGANLHIFDGQMPELLKRFRVVRYDSRGHGESVVSDGPASIAQFGEDALAIMDVLGLRKVHWLGLSMGGMVGLWLLAHQPDRFDRAVIANTGAQIPGPEMWNSRIKGVREIGMDAFAGSVAERWFTKAFRDADPEVVAEVADMVRRTPLEGYVAGCAAIRDADLREAVRSIANPVLVIVGRHDASAPPGLGALLAQSIPNARLATLEASHISNIEAEEEFTRISVDFLTETGEAKKPAARRKTPAKRAAQKEAPEPPAGEEVAPAETPPARRRGGRKAAARRSEPAPEQPLIAEPAPLQEAEGKKAAARRAPAQKAPAGRAAAKKAAVKKTAARRGPAKKAAKKVAAKKAPTKKAPVKRAPARKTALKKAAVKKAAVKKTSARTAVRKSGAAKKAPTKKAAAKKIPAKKTPVKKISAKKSPAKKGRAQASAARSSTSRKPTGRGRS